MTPAITLADAMEIPMPATRALSVPAVDTPSTPAAPVRLRRRLTSVLLTLGLTVGILAATAPRAEAASYVAGCFVSNKNVRISGVAVQLQAYIRGTWVTFASSSLPESQCIGWTIHPDSRGLYLRMIVNYQANGAYWYGLSPLMALPGEERVGLGVGVVTCYGCV